jgi:hypothetical protein
MNHPIRTPAMATEHDTVPPRLVPKHSDESSVARDSAVPPELEDAHSTPPYEPTPRRRSIGVAIGAIALALAAAVLFFVLGTSSDQADPGAPAAPTAPAEPADAPAAPAAGEIRPAD